MALNENHDLVQERVLRQMVKRNKYPDEPNQSKYPKPPEPYSTALTKKAIRNSKWRQSLVIVYFLIFNDLANTWIW